MYVYVCMYHITRIIGEPYILATYSKNAIDGILN